MQMAAYNRLKSFRTRKIMQVNDIEGTSPSNFLFHLRKRNNMRTDDIDGASPPKIPKYSGKRSYHSLRKPVDKDEASLTMQSHDVWYDRPSENISPNRMNSEQFSNSTEFKNLRKSYDATSANTAAIVESMRPRYEKKRIFLPAQQENEAFGGANDTSTRTIDHPQLIK